MDILFIIYLILLLVFTIYLILFKYYNNKVRQNLKNVKQTETTIHSILPAQINDCHNKIVYCTTSKDCSHICTNANENEFICNSSSICSQSTLSSTSANTAEIVCDQNKGFLPTLTADEFFEPYWICLNTRPYIFNNQQKINSFVCASGKLNFRNFDTLYEDCICQGGDIKVKDILRNNIPICIQSHKLSLYPNLIIS